MRTVHNPLIVPHYGAYLLVTHQEMPNKDMEVNMDINNTFKQVQSRKTCINLRIEITPVQKSVRSFER